MSLAHNDLSPPTRAFRPDRPAFGAARPHRLGDTSCMQAFDRLRALAPGFWHTLPVCGTGTVKGFGAVLQVALCAPTDAFPYAAIAAEAERPLARGIRSATPLALLLLAALALGRDGADARALAGTALEIAARLGEGTRHLVRTLHAALIGPFGGAPAQATADLAALCEAEARPACAHLYLAGNGFIAGMALPELARHVERAAGLAAAAPHAAGLHAELAARALLLRGLAQQGAPLPAFEMAVPAAQRACFGFWITRLQAAMYRGEHVTALHAATQAEALNGPLLPVGDRTVLHLFAALALAPSNDPGSCARLALHCAALRRLARQLPACARILLQCADAARARPGGRPLDALRGFEGAAVAAASQDRHGLAALAWEQSAQQAQACGLGAALLHYRREALASCEQWGAGGRAAALRQAWGLAADAGGGAEHDRVLRAGRAGELGLSIAHEVNQPLAAISLHAAAARKWLRRPEPDIERALSSLSLIGEAGRHAGDIVRSIQRMASCKEQEMGSVAVDQTIADTLRLLQQRLRKHGIEVELALGLGERAIHASRVQLQQVLTNLVVNATEALARNAPDGVARRIRIASRPHGEHEVEVAVADNGPGIAPQHAGRVFGSLFSTKPDSTGMGLSISLAIVRAHGGHIDYQPCEPHGACFRFRLPVQSSHP
jgi:signal transduction histidine kinase